jgi:hypothetical protein
LVSVDLLLSSLWAVFSCLCMPSNLWLDARHCEFCHVGGWIFWYCCKSWTLFCYLENVWFFWVYFLWFVREIQSSTHANHFL